jgi:hypothetical protein
MTHRFDHRFTVLVPLALVAGCAGPEGAGVQVRAVSTAMEDSGATLYALAEGRLRLRHIELDLPDGMRCAELDGLLAGASCRTSDGEDKISIAGPLDVDLVAGTSSPSLDHVVIPPGSYRRVDLRVEPDQQDVSMAARAGFERDGQPLTLELALKFNEDIRVERPGGVAIEPGMDLVAGFAVGDWLAGIDVGACIDDGDLEVEGGVVRIHEDSTSGGCSGIEGTIKDNMKNSGRLERD